MEEDALITLLDSIADADDPHSGLLKWATKLLTCQDGPVRSSAARALAVLVPAKAIALLSDRLPDEGNRFVQAQFRSSIHLAIATLQERK